jgi:hypothetical protein
VAGPIAGTVFGLMMEAMTALRRRPDGGQMAMMAMVAKRTRSSRRS